MLKELNELRKENQELGKKLQVYEKCDPKKMEELKQKVKLAKEGANRWTDNLYEMESWMKKQNPGISGDELAQNFPILKDLDYV